MKKEKRGVNREIRKHALGLCALFIVLCLLYFSLPTFSRLTGFTIGPESVSTATVSVNTDSDVGVIRNDFYGVNIQRYASGNSPYGIDTSTSSSILDAQANLSWHEQMWSDSGMGYYRIQMRLNNYYSNSSNGSPNMTGDMSKFIEEVRWAFNNHKRILVEFNAMPVWLANVSSICDQSNETCPPSDYIQYTNIVLDSLNRISSSGLYASVIDVEPWNEPDLASEWLKNTGNNNINQSIYYNRLYNVTYIAIKSTYPNMIVGGPAVANVGCSLASNFLANFSNQMQFISFHTYTYEPSFYDNIQSAINTSISKCAVYSANCSRLIISEFNVGSGTNSNGIIIKNQTSRKNEYGMQIALAYIGGLLYPYNLSMVFFDWAEQYKYSNTQYYPEYPQKWSMVSEPQLDNEYNPPYNVTKDFTHYHAAGNTVVSSLSNNGNIKVVASKNDSSSVDITLISNSTNDVNVSLSLSGAITDNYNTVQDSKTGDNYTISSGVANVGVLHQYDIKYYTLVNITTEVSQNVTQNSTDTNQTLNNSTTTSSGTTTSSAGGGGSAGVADNSNLSNPSETASNQDNFGSGSSNGQQVQNSPPTQQEQNNVQNNGTDFVSSIKSFVGGLSKSSWGLAVIAFVTGIIVLIIAILIFIFLKRRKEMKELVDWVQKGRAMGHEDHHLKQTLVNHGLDGDKVDDAMERT